MSTTKIVSDLKRDRSDTKLLGNQWTGRNSM